MSVFGDKGSGRRWALVALLGAAGISLAAPAAAQGLFGAIFDALSGRPAYRAPAAPAYAYAPAGDPLDVFTDRLREPRPASRAGTGRGMTYCVRTCDGRYFPVRSHANTTPVEMCRAMCPASETKTFSGGAIDHAVARDGTRYSDLDNAYVYRDRIVDGCTCNGKNAFGLAPIEATSDPTLREGDIVVTAEGLMAYTPKRGAETANFTPVDRARLSREFQSKLATIEVARPQ